MKKWTGMSKPPTRRHSQTCCRISTVLHRCRNDQLQREVPLRHRGDDGDGVNVGPNSCTAAAQPAGNDSNNKVHAAGPKSGESIWARSVAEISEPVGSNCGNSGNCPAIRQKKKMCVCVCVCVCVCGRAPARQHRLGRSHGHREKKKKGHRG